MNTNKFAAIFQARQSLTTDYQEPLVKTEKPPLRRLRPSAATGVVAQPETDAKPQAPVIAPIKKGGREIGKRSDPNFNQVTAYIPAQLHNNATIALRLANQNRIDAEKEDFSELLARLLANWYETQTYYRPRA